MYAAQYDATTLILTPVASAVGGAYLLGVLLLIGFRAVPSFMVYSVVFIKVLLPAAAGAFLLAHPFNNSTSTAGSSDNDDSQCVASWRAPTPFTPRLASPPTCARQRQPGPLCSRRARATCVPPLPLPPFPCV